MTPALRRVLALCAMVVAALVPCAVAAGATGPAGVAGAAAGDAASARELAEALTERAGAIARGAERRARPPRVTEREAIAIGQRQSEVRDWIRDHPLSRTAAELDREDRVWTTYFVSRDEDGAETTEAQVFVDADTGAVNEIRVGPQVAWMMARGYDGSFGRAINRPAIWLTLCALFLLPLLRIRRLLSWRTLDLLVLLSFSVSLIWFNRGEIFTSVPLQYPPLVYLCARLVWIGLRGGRGASAASAPAEGPALAAPAGGPVDAARPAFRGWAPTWLLVTVMAVALALRFGLNAFDSNVIDVGYAGVIGADLIAEGATPYGNFPSDSCSTCDTYGPLNYLAYMPFEQAMSWSGRWDDLPAAHGAASFFDLLALAGMAGLGWRLGGRRLAAALALAWAAFPFTAYALESNANDSLVAALLIAGLLVAGRPAGRGLALGLALAAKFGPGVLLPLWSRQPFPRARRSWRTVFAFAGGLGAAVLLTGWVLALDGADGFRAFWSRTLGYQFGRDSPFSIWGQFPGLRPVQLALTVLVALAALALLRWPRRLDLLGMCALSGALMIAVQLTLTHWFYLYIPWFLPFALVAMVPEWPRRTPPAEPPPAQRPEAAEQDVAVAA